VLWLAQPEPIPISHKFNDLPDVGIGPKVFFQFLDTFSPQPPARNPGPWRDAAPPAPTQ
jgi:hypothetical protein